MILKLEPFSGISGDMMLGALIDLAGGEDDLLALPARLGLERATVSIDPVKKCGIACTKVTIEDASEPVARHLSDIVRLIEAADLQPRARDLALAIFTLLGEAEAAVHDVPLAQIHFHEVGAVDSILDVVGTAVLLARLYFNAVISGPVCTGSGFVACDHGRMPVPAPATERLLRGMPCEAGPVPREMTTPTGAAILRALDPSFDPIPHRVVATGYGAGTRDLEQPNCLRLSLIEPLAGTDPVWVIQTNIDDAPGELLGEHLQRRLLAAGALDITLAPLMMKKGRPGQRLEVLARAADRDALADVILSETTTIGVRYFPVARRILPREVRKVATMYGDVRVKVVTSPSGEVRRTPEYDDCVRLAEQAGVSLHEVMRAARHAAHD